MRVGNSAGRAVDKRAGDITSITSMRKRTMLRGRWSIGLAFALLAVALWGSGQAAAEELKIGVIAPLSGPGAGWGLALRGGAELAAEDMNAQGGLEVAGTKYKVVVIAYDDKYQAQGGADAANRLVFLDKVKFIVGPMGSAVGLAAQEFTEPNKVILIGDSFSTKLLSPKKPYTFRTTMT